MARPAIQSFLPDPTDARQTLPPIDVPVLVAGYMDYQRVGGGRKVAFLEHGVGQNYGDGHPSNPGGEDRHGIGLYLCPNQRVADLNLTTYPYARAEVIGSPWLDFLATHVKPSRTKNKRTTIAFSFRWENTQHPSARSALPHYREALRPLTKNYRVIITTHPRIYDRVAPTFQDMDMEVTPLFTDVVKHADILLVDNSSAGPEFAAATGRPIVWLNAPWYDRTFTPGMRYWDFTKGQITVDDPADLQSAIERAILDPDEAKECRAQMVGSCFAYLDGKASLRAVEAMIDYAK